MTNRVSANEVRLIAAQTAAASAATAAAVAEQMAQSRERLRQECQVKASQEIPNFLRGIEASARLGFDEVFFAAIEEDEDMYWNYVAEDLRQLGYEVDIGFLEERRRFRNPNTVRYEDRNPRHDLRYIDVDYQQFRNDVGQSIPDVVSCCGYCRRYKLDEHGSRRSRRLSRDVEGISIWDTDGFLFGILEILWVLTIIGPIFGACRRFGCCAIVCDSARTKMTCKAPYITGVVDHYRYLNPGAIWYVKVSWRQNLETTSAATATVRPEGIPIAIPIDGIGPGSTGTGQEGFVPVKPAEITYVSPSAR